MRHSDLLRNINVINSPATVATSYLENHQLSVEPRSWCIISLVRPKAICDALICTWHSPALPPPVNAKLHKPQYVFFISVVYRHHPALLHRQDLIRDRLLTFLVAFSTLILKVKTFLFWKSFPIAIYRFLGLISWRWIQGRDRWPWKERLPEKGKF